MTISKPPLQVLRGILRLIKTPKLSPSIQKKKEAKPTTNSIDRRHVLKMYKKHQSETDPFRIDILTRHAMNFHQLLSDVKERERLYQLDSGAEVLLSPKEMSRRAAARAGLQMPKTNDDLE